MQCLVAVPTFESIHPATFKSIYDLDAPKDWKLTFEYITGHDVTVARNKIARLAENFNRLFFVDSDIVLPKDTLKKLNKMPFDVCTGVYPKKRSTEGHSNVWAVGGKDFVDENNIKVCDMSNYNEPFEIKGCGMGCALINSTVFSRVPFPWFQYTTYNTGETLSEDLNFCLKAGICGVTFGVDPSIRCGHIMTSVQFD